MKIELTYYDITEKKYIFEEPITSEGFQFIPNEGDTLLLNNWAYVISRKEFTYDYGTTKITINCIRESKQRK
ncbi:hypothetical protein [Metabacillus malikii]|uniref:Uncharacterized protein n=1 Tax=Metabacillus malikii TaxID=1504265 RepID=A0ABT9ZD78_9BACI|nr:hypothetical protein [Metabacillus malikii]MDQ0230192.1 hypothetical protein [Metabacillus malikii]